MFKKDWIVFSILATFTVGLAVFSAVYRQPSGAQVTWLAYVVGVAIIATIAYLCYILYLVSKQSFASMLKKENFNSEKVYVSKDVELHFDFTNKRVANNYISTKPLFPFSDVIGYCFETSRVSDEAYEDDVEVSPDEVRFVSIVITVRKPSREFEYLYIPMFEVKVESADIGETLEEISPELVEKYPDLEQLVDLQKDIQTIIEMNKSEHKTHQ